MVPEPPSHLLLPPDLRLLLRRRVRPRRTSSKVGVDNICFETDYPHSDSTWPHSRETAHEADGPSAAGRGPQADARQRHRDARSRPRALSPPPRSDGHDVDDAAPDRQRPTPMPTYRLTIGGESVEGGAGTYDIVNPATEEVVGRRPRGQRRAGRRCGRRRRGRVRQLVARPSPEERAALLDARRRPASTPSVDELVPVRAGRDRRHHAGRQDDAVPPGRGAAAPLRRRVRWSRRIDPLPPAVMPTTALGAGRAHLGGVAHRAPVGVVDLHHVVQLPDDQHGRQDRPGAGHGQHRGGQASAPGPPRRASRMVELMNEAGFPPGVVNVVIGRGHRAVRGASSLTRTPTWSRFTGSTGGRPAHRRGGGGDR